MLSPRPAAGPAGAGEAPGSRQGAQDPVTTLPELIAWHALERPDSPAILGDRDRMLTYADLHGLVREHGRALRKHGIGPRDRVALVLPDGYHTAVGLITLLCNAVCVPVNPVLHQQEIDALFRRLRPKAVLVPDAESPVRRIAEAAGSGVLAAGPPEDGLRVLAPVAPAPDRSDRLAPTAGDWALLLTTSGTTGQPKLVPLSHHNVLAAARATGRAYALRPEDRRLNFMPLYHVQGVVGSLIASLAAGSSLVCVPSLDVRRLPAWTEQWGVTWYSATPTMHAEILRQCDRSRADLMRTALRFIRAGSAALPAALRTRLETEIGVPVVESYGMTEAHQIASTPLDHADHRAGTVGRPTGSRVAVRRLSSDDLASDGELGEILIQGDNVAAGYLDDPEANRHAFVDGWFRTGDLGMLEAGFVVLRGRLKEMINRAGEKISPKEVDDVILSNPAVADTACFPVPDSRLGEAVGAVVVLGEGHQMDEEGLRSFVAGRLARFKVPRHVVFARKIPRTSGGKVRRHELAKALGVVPPERTKGVTEVATMSPVEITLVALWQEVLRLKTEIGLDEDFFYLGGDSLTGARLLQMVEDAFGVELPPLAMYDEAHTVRGMASMLEEHRRSGDPDPVRGARAP